MSNNILKLPTLCLNMIVKNESKIITRLLESVYTLIDTYCICDTGSTDNTCERITTFFNEKGIKGKIVYEPFVDFSYNRNYALKSALGLSDYVLLLDADMTISIKKFNKSLLLNGDCFSLFQGNKTFYYQNTRIIKNNEKFYYVGSTHEYINVPNNMPVITLDKDIIFINDVGDGCCKADKYERDIRLLKKELEINKDNSRTFFYLANSYYDSKMFEEAIEMYKKRIQMGGWIEEIWYSYYRIGLCFEELKNFPYALYYWLEGYNQHKERLENIYRIVYYYRLNEKNQLAYEFLKIIKETLQKHKEKKINRNLYLFVEEDVYSYKFNYEYLIIAYYLGIKNINDDIVITLDCCDDKGLIASTLSNMKFYKYILQPEKTFHFNNVFWHSINGKEYEFRSSTPSIIQNKSNGYIMNIRFVNYQLVNNYKTYDYIDYILSINECLNLDRDFHIINRKLIGEINHDGRNYGGIEDLRLFNDTKEDKIIFIGVGLNKNNKIGIVNGEYISNKDSLEFKELGSSFSNNECEKNWVYVNYKNDICIVYSWSPLIICNIDNENKINIIKIVELPGIFNHARGSSCGCNFNDEIWFIVHLVSFESPRHYYHLMCVFDTNMKLLRYSAPFKFSESCIEYSLGLVVEVNQVIISYSECDSSSKINIFTKQYIENLLIYGL
jgi:tetratricopeptide (TPR) repeat protein